MSEKFRQSSGRRSFLNYVGAAAGVVGVTLVKSPVAEAAGDTSWRPARHAQDDWLDQLPGKHRFVFDTTTTDGMALALQFGGNYFAANADAYGLKESDLAVLIIARHRSTPFGYNDAMWAKYGKQFSDQAQFTDPQTKEPPKINVYTTAGDVPGQGGRLDALIKKGVHIAVCQTSSRGIATRIARDNGLEMESVMKDMAANLIPNARLVPAGIVTVNRAQEHGYSFVYAM